MEHSAMTEGMMPGPDGCILRFFYDTERNEQATVQEGRAIFDTVLFVDVITPGQKSSTPRFEVERIWSDKSRSVLNMLGETKKSYKYNEYREQVEKFKAQEQVGELGGTPLKMWPRIDRALAATLMAANVFTVEQLANLSDNHLDIVGLGARELRAQAIAYLADAGDGAQLSSLVDKTSKLEQEVRDLKDALALANNQNEELKRGQPSSALKDITLTA